MAREKADPMKKAATAPTVEKEAPAAASAAPAEKIAPTPATATVKAAVPTEKKAEAADKKEVPSEAAPADKKAAPAVEKVVPAAKEPRQYRGISGTGDGGPGLYSLADAAGGLGGLPPGGYGPERGAGRRWRHQHDGQLHRRNLDRILRRGW